jgi:2-amino-4-hydroxy-6-hydroxymethyldihydropteridine diphosphokinase
LKRIYLSLGSNVGDREGNLRKALERLASDDVRVLRNSRIYETEPVDYKDQAWFLNQVVEAETALFPMQLLTRIGRVEHESTSSSMPRQSSTRCGWRFRIRGWRTGASCWRRWRSWRPICGIP